MFLIMMIRYVPTSLLPGDKCVSWCAAAKCDMTIPNVGWMMYSTGVLHEIQTKEKKKRFHV